jgi:hypothetical protein
VKLELALKFIILYSYIKNYFFLINRNPCHCSELRQPIGPYLPFLRLISGQFSYLVVEIYMLFCPREDSLKTILKEGRLLLANCLPRKGALSPNPLFFSFCSSSDESELVLDSTNSLLIFFLFTTLFFKKTKMKAGIWLDYEK